MRQRVISSVAIVVIAVVPLVFGGPVFGVLMVALSLAGYAEFRRLGESLLAHQLRGPAVGYFVVLAFGIAALLETHIVLTVSVVAAAVFAPLTLALIHPPEPAAVAAASLDTLGGLYLGLPVYTAISLRETAGPVGSEWLQQLANVTAVGWPSSPRGLAWTALVLFAIWIGDSVAYLGGRAFGRRPLAPRISPKKTIEGALAGLIGSTVTALICSQLFGLHVPPLVTVALGLVLGVAGQLGDLIESLLKRQAGVKDSGALIPGHGGILDRIDALLLTFPVAWAVASIVNGTAP